MVFARWRRCEPHLRCASLRHPESTTQTASPFSHFCTAHLQSVPIHHNGPPFLFSKLPLRMRRSEPNLTWFLGPTRVQIPNSISIGSAVFAQFTAERPYILQWTALSPQNCPFSWGSGPHLIHDSLGQSEPTSQAHGRVSLYFIMGSPSPQNAPSHGGIWTPSNTFPGPTRVLNLNGISIGSAVFARLTIVSDRQTNHDLGL